MSFTTDASKELLTLQNKKTCCRRALLLGMLLGARKSEEAEPYTCYFYDEQIALFVSEQLKRIFHVDAVVEEKMRVGRLTFILSFESRAVSDFLNTLEEDPTCAPHIAVGFRCGLCQASFLRGVLVGCGSITDPKKRYHLEMVFPSEKRATFIAEILTNVIGAPGRIKRNERFSLYYKNNGAILDLLYFVGSNHSSIYMANSFIERDIRNNENRATNCVTRNISRSVDSAQKQIAAIEKLIQTRAIESLPEELRYTALLRVENESASLTELAALHKTPISKSGLNRRLTKLMEAANEI